MHSEHCRPCKAISPHLCSATRTPLWLHDGSDGAHWIADRCMLTSAFGLLITHPRAPLHSCKGMTRGAGTRAVRVTPVSRDTARETCTTPHKASSCTGAGTSSCVLNSVVMALVVPLALQYLINDGYIIPGMFIRPDYRFNTTQAALQLDGGGS
jgi:hypothetical protein